MISKVDEFVYRSARPTKRADVPSYIKSMLSLEGAAEDDAEDALFAPLHVLRAPISFWQIYFTGITQHMLTNVVRMIVRAPKPILVHCQHGQDRTGLVIAAYHVLQNYKTKEAAMAEALKFGYRYWLNFGLNKTWERFQKEK